MCSNGLSVCHYVISMGGKNAKLIYLHWAQKMAAGSGMVSAGISVHLSQKKIFLKTSCSRAVLSWVHLKVTTCSVAT